MKNKFKLLWILIQTGLLLFILGLCFIHIPDKQIFQPYFSILLTVLIGIFYVPNYVKQIKNLKFNESISN